MTTSTLEMIAKKKKKKDEKFYDTSKVTYLNEMIYFKLFIFFY